MDQGKDRDEYEKKKANGWHDQLDDIGQAVKHLNLSFFSNAGVMQSNS